MTTEFKAKPPEPIKWGSIPKHILRSLWNVADIIGQIFTPYKSRPEEIAEFPEPAPGNTVSESIVKQCQWIFDEVEGRRSQLEQKAQSTFSLMLFLVPFLASLFIFIVGKGTTSKTFGITLTLTVVSAIFLLLAFSAAIRAIAVKGGETLFLDAVIDESGQFRKYSEAYHARGLLYCASMNTATNDHIAQFVKGAHILSAAAVLTLLIASIPLIGLFATPPSPVQTQIVGPVNLTFPELTALHSEVAGIKSDIQKLSTGKASLDDFRLLGDRIDQLDAKLSEVQKTTVRGPNNKAAQTSPAH